MVRGGLPKRWAPAQRERGTKQPPCWLPGDPIIQWEGGQGHTHMHINMRTHSYTNTYSLTHTQTHKSSRAQMGPTLWHWFVFLIPPSSPQFFISHAASLVRLPIGTSQSLSWGRGGGGRGGEARGGEGAYLERWKGEREGREERRRRNNNLTANDGMPGSYPQRAGLHTDQQLPESIWIITNIYPACWPMTASLNTQRNNTVRRCSCCSKTPHLLLTVQ